MFEEFAGLTELNEDQEKYVLNKLLSLPQEECYYITMDIINEENN
jgi:hypothetical protein